MKINNFRGDLTDISARKEALVDAIATLCRGMTCRTGILARADGSAQWEQDQTVVLVAVHGPASTTARKELPSKAVVEVVLKPFAGVPGERQRFCFQNETNSLFGYFDPEKFFLDNESK